MSEFDPDVADGSPAEIQDFADLEAMDNHAEQLEALIELLGDQFLVEHDSDFALLAPSYDDAEEVPDVELAENAPDGTDALVTVDGELMRCTTEED